MNVYSNSAILFGLGCAAVFVAVVSIVWFAVEFYRERKAELDFFNGLKTMIDEAVELQEEDNNEGQNSN